MPAGDPQPVMTAVRVVTRSLADDDVEGGEHAFDEARVSRGDLPDAAGRLGTGSLRVVDQVLLTNDVEHFLSGGDKHRVSTESVEISSIAAALARMRDRAATEL